MHTETPLHFEGCHPDSGAYHQTFHRAIRNGRCPACYGSLYELHNCRLYELHVEHVMCHGAEWFVRGTCKHPVHV